MRFWEYVKHARDPTSIAVFMEDTAAVSGVVIAGACTYLAHSTGLVIYDAIGSILVGTLLACTAWFLIQNNRKLLIGRAMSPTETARVLRHLDKDPVICAVYDAKSEEIGPGLYRFKAEIAFAGDLIIDRHLSRKSGRTELYAKLKSAAARGDDAALDRYIRHLGRQVVGAVGWEIDRLEQEIRSLVPGIRHVDLETDRGRWFRASLDPPITEAAGSATSTSLPADSISSFVDLEYDNERVQPEVAKDSYWSFHEESWFADDEPQAPASCSIPRPGTRVEPNPSLPRAPPVTATLATGDQEMLTTLSGGAKVLDKRPSEATPSTAAPK